MVPRIRAVRSITSATIATWMLLTATEARAETTTAPAAEPEAPDDVEEVEASDPVERPPPAPPPPKPALTAEQARALLDRVDALEREVERLRATEAATADPTREPPEGAPELADEVAAPIEPAPPTTADAVPTTIEGAQGEVEFNRPPDFADGFHFGSYGRVVAGTDHRGRAPRDGDIVARGTRLDESTYAELELRREDYWEATDSYTRIVATIAFAHPVFHYNGQFDATLGVRNLYIEESGLGLKNLRVWAGSRMYRGDDIYLLDFWPLDNLNTIGGGLSYTWLDNLTLKLHAGINQPQSPFFFETAQRPLPLDQVGDTTVAINDRQKFISSAKLSNIFNVGKTGGIKPVIYGEVHYTSESQREIADRQFEELPDDVGFLIGTQLGMFTGKRGNHLNLIFRYASGLAAYGEFGSPFQLGPDRTSKGAREVLVAASGNYEIGPFGLLLGSYFRNFRNASEQLDFADVSEGIIIMRPTVWFGKLAGLSVEGSYQAQRRGVLVDPDRDGDAVPQFGQMGRFGIVPFLSPGGRGNFARPHIRLIYLASVRDQGARRLYAEHDVFSLRKVDHFFGVGAEWWFGSTSYFRD